MFTLGRSIDIHYPTNRLILIIALISTILAMLMMGDILLGLKIGGTIFLTWVMSREADPKREYVAFLAVAIAILYIYFSNIFLVSFLELFFLVLLLRLINQSSGDQPTLLDAGIIFGLGAYLYYSSANPLYLMLYAIGLFISQVFKEYQLLNIMIAAGAGFSLGYLIYLMSNDLTFISPLLSPILVIALVTIYAVISYLDHKKMVSDDKGKLINPVRIVRSQLFFAFSILLLTFFSKAYLGNMIVYLATITAIIIYQPLNKIFHFEN